MLSSTRSAATLALRGMSRDRALRAPQKTSFVQLLTAPRPYSQAIFCSYPIPLNRSSLLYLEEASRISIGHLA
jgi:hypothetical protein